MRCWPWAHNWTYTAPPARPWLFWDRACTKCGKRQFFNKFFEKWETYGK